jgi:hypothetical protein
VPNLNKKKNPPYKEKLTKKSYSSMTAAQREPSDRPIFQLKTLNGKVFKCLSNILRTVLSNVTMTVTRDMLRMMALDVNMEIVMHLEMPPAAFESFRCEEDIKVDFKVVKLANTLKIWSARDTLTLAIYPDRRRMEVRIQNDAKHKDYEQWVPLIECDESMMAREFPVIDMQPPEILSSEVLKICNQLGNVKCRFAEIQIVNNQIIFIGAGGGDADPVFAIDIEPDEEDERQAETLSDGMIASGVFPLQLLQPLTKSSEISTKVRMHVQCTPQMLPLLVCEYGVCGMGTLRYLLCAKGEPVK